MCKPNVQEKRASEPLSIAQFLSAFLLLGIGTALSLLLIVIEHLYMRYLQTHVDKKNAEAGGCFSLLSQVCMYVCMYVYIYIYIILFILYTTQNCNILHIILLTKFRASDKITHSPEN